MCHWRIIADSRELVSGTTRRRQYIKVDPKSIREVVHLRIVATQTKGLENIDPYPCTAGDARVS
jgi:hypothetical protein